MDEPDSDDLDGAYLTIGGTSAICGWTYSNDLDEEYPDSMQTIITHEGEPTTDYDWYLSPPSIALVIETALFELSPSDTLPTTQVTVPQASNWLTILPTPFPWPAEPKYGIPFLFVAMLAALLLAARHPMAASFGFLAILLIPTAYGFFDGPTFLCLAIITIATSLFARTQPI